MCAWAVQRVFIAIVNYINLCICGFTNFLISWEVYVSLDEVDDSNIETTARININDSFGSHPCMIFHHVLMENNLYKARCLCGD